MSRACPDCGATFNGRSPRANHMNNKHSKCACAACGKPFYNESRRDQHAQMKGPHTTNKEHATGNAGPQSTVKNHPCTVCERRFATADGLRCHVKAKHSTSDLVRTSPIFGIQNLTHNFTITSLAGNPKRKPQVKNHLCSVCGRRFATADQLRSHGQAKHSISAAAGNGKPKPKVNNHSCTDCERRFATARGLQSHSKAKHLTSAVVGNNSIFGIQSVTHHGTVASPQNTTEHSSTSDKTNTDDVNTAARSFHDNHARAKMHQQLDPKFEKFEDITSTLYEKLQEQASVTKRVKVGSASERTDVPGISDFDVLFTKVDLEVTASSAGNSEYSLKRSSGEIVAADKYKQTIKGEIQKILNVTKFGKTDVTILEHGPAITLNVRDASFESFTIDVVPSLELTDGRCFVSKSGTWCMSHSYGAKVRMANLDAGNKCGKEVYRACKVITKKEPNLHHVTSYQLKSALFRLTDKRTSRWERSQIGERILDLIRYLRDSYDCGQLLDYYDANKNLITELSPSTRGNAVDRFNVFLDNPSKMFKI